LNFEKIRPAAARRVALHREFIAQEMSKIRLLYAMEVAGPRERAGEPSQAREDARHACRQRRRRDRSHAAAGIALDRLACCLLPVE
jgi:hypothetical protein